jgi:hypothetical protein
MPSEVGPLEWLSADAAAAAIASLALLISASQWLLTRHAERVRLLLGEKETVGFEALRSTRSQKQRVFGFRYDRMDALVLAAVLEGSDRARLQVYRALEALHVRRSRDEIVRAGERHHAQAGESARPDAGEL